MRTKATVMCLHLKRSSEAIIFRNQRETMRIENSIINQEGFN